MLTVRSGEGTAAADGTPSWRVLALDTADSAGNYRFERKGVPEAWLEVRERLDSPRQAFPQACLARFSEDSLPLPDTLQLSASGTIQGRLSDRSKPLPEAAWITVPGTSAVAPAGEPDSAGRVALRLEAVPPGDWPVVVVTAKPCAVGPIPGIPPVVQVSPDTVKDVGPIFYNESGKGALGPK